MKKFVLLLLILFAFAAMTYAQKIIKRNAISVIHSPEKFSLIKSNSQTAFRQENYSIASKTLKPVLYNHGFKPVKHNAIFTKSICDTLIPASFTGYCADSLTLYTMGSSSPSDSGYVSGQNTYHFSEIGQRFNNTATDTITDVYIMYALKAGTTGNTYVNIYSVVNGKPGALLGTSSIIVKGAIDTTNSGINFNNAYHFSTPVITKGDFIVSIAIPTTYTQNTDELAMYSGNIYCGAHDTTGYFYYNSIWYSFYVGFGVNLDMTIFPKGCSSPAIPIADFSASDTAIYSGSCISFADHSINAPANWKWAFNGATPATSALKNPSGICYNNVGNYSVTLVASNASGSDSITKTNYVHVSLNTNPPAVNFTASTATVVPGTTVNFTDLSTNTPTAWQWTVSPSTGIVYTGGTTATSKNPKIIFNTIGMYTIALTATNSYGANTYTVPNYINVSNSAYPSHCDTLMPPSFSTACLDSLSIYVAEQTAPYDSGFVTGQNIYHFGELAQLYKSTTADTIYNVYIMYAVKAGTTGNTYVKIYSVDSTGKPGTLLGTSSSITKNAIDTSNSGVNYNNVYHFPTPVITTGDFFVSVSIPTTYTYQTDELAIFATNISCSSVDSAAFLLDGTSWYSFVTGYGVNIDMAIFPSACSAAATCSAQYNMYADTAVLHHYFVVNMATGTPPIYYYWTWGDGSSDTIPYPSHTYSTAGEYSICLYIYDFLGCSSTYCDSSYIQKSGNSVISVDVIPQGSEGLQENTNNNYFILFPNPAIDNITIIAPGKSSIEISNIEGQIIRSFTTSVNKMNFDISGFAKGLYFVKAKTKNGTIFKKFIKQ